MCGVSPYVSLVLSSPLVLAAELRSDLLCSAVPIAVLERLLRYNCSCPRVACSDVVGRVVSGVFHRHHHLSQEPAFLHSQYLSKPFAPLVRARALGADIIWTISRFEDRPANSSAEWGTHLERTPNSSAEWGTDLERTGRVGHASRQVGRVGHASDEPYSRQADHGPVDARLIPGTAERRGHVRG